MVQFNEGFEAGLCKAIRQKKVKSSRRLLMRLVRRGLSAI